MLLDGGYRIVPVVPGQKRPAIKDWPRARLGISDLARYTHHGVGVLCGQGETPVVAFDVDTTDLELAYTFVAWCERHLGFPLKRVGKAPKILLLYRAEHEGWSKSASAWFESPDKDRHRLEVLGTGQQFVAYHTHPDTGEPYVWTDAQGGASAVRAADLTVVSQTQVHEAVVKFEAIAQNLLGFTRTAGSSARYGEASNTEEDAWRFKLPVGLTVDSARKLLSNIEAEDYDLWLRAGMALHHEFSGSDEGLDLWDEWSSSASTYIGREDLESRWAGFGQVTREPTTARWLLMMGNKAKNKALEVAQGAQGDEPRHETSELDNARRMINRYGHKLMHVPEMDDWFLWTGNRWEKTVYTTMGRLAIETVEGLKREAETIKDSEELLKFLRFYRASKTKAMFNNMVSIASFDARVSVPASQLDRFAHLLGVANGAVDLRTGVLLAPEQEHRITIATDTGYDPAATCPLFEETVSDVFSGDVEMVGFFQRLIGYSLMGQPKESVIVIPYGSGANGKSTILGAIQRVLGNHAVSAASETLLSIGKDTGSSAGGARADLIALRGSRFVYVSEPEEGSELREGLLKSMTGGEKISARAPYAKRNIEFTPTWVTFMPTNHRPIVKGDDFGIWRRLLLIPFTRNFDTDKAVRKDVDRPRKLAMEAEGILAWCVRGALAYQREGLQPPAAVEQARDAYKADMDLLDEWKELRCEKGQGYADTSMNLWIDWKYHAESRGLLGYVPNQRTFGRRLAAMGFEPIRDSQGVKGRGWKGIRVKRVAD